MDMTRRSLVLGGGAFAGLAATAQAKVLAPTSAQDLGPFYPVVRPRDEDADLTRLRGARGVANGEPINVIGRVLYPSGHPVTNARIELWQANAVGRYDHPGDVRDDAALDPNFQGYATLTTGRGGFFKFRTIKPAAYKIPGDIRTPHIHFDIHGRRERLVTQMYFPDEPLNERDLILRTADPRESVIAKAIPRLSGDPAAAAFQWIVVLNHG